MLNYLDDKALERFMRCVTAVLEPGGIFLADINTLYGFEEVAQGALILDGDEGHGTIEAYFDGKRLISQLRLFEKTENLYRKEEGVITQYFYPSKRFRNFPGLKLLEVIPLSLYGGEPDKELLLLSRSN